jgi:hypothetical protein
MMDVGDTGQQSEHVEDESMAVRNGIQFESEVDSDNEDDMSRDSTDGSDEEIHHSVPSASSNNNPTASIPRDKLRLYESLSSLSFTQPRPKKKCSLVRLPNTFLLSINFCVP